MASREFNKELREYISTRRKSGLGIFKFSSKPKAPPSAYAGHSENENVAEFVKEEYQKRKGWLSKAFGGLFGAGKEAESEDSIPDEEIIKDTLNKEEIARDMKELARISLSAIKRLPPNEIHEFRNSEDFATLKRILKKHELIKQG